MVAKACRCLTCRLRKVKCDQQWPECGQCKRGKRRCPGPPATIKFVSNETPPPPLAANSKNIDLSVSIPSIPASQIAAQLVHAIQSDTATYNPTYLGSFVKHLPSMLDSSPALAATVACCLDACKRSNSLPSSTPRLLDPVLNGRALAEIHHALADSEECLRDSTFYAVVLLQRMETVLVTRKVAWVPCWSIHAGGLSELVKYRGVVDSSNDDVWDTMLENFGPMASHAVMCRQKSFFTTPEWQHALKHKPARSLTEKLMLEIFAQLAFLPSLAICVHAWRGGKGCLDKPMHLALAVYDALQNIGREIDQTLIPRLKMRPADDFLPRPPIATLYVDVPRQVARVLCWHAMNTIVINDVLMQLGGGGLDVEPCSAAQLRSQNLLMSRRLWMLSEEARKAGLMRYYFYPGPLAMTLDSAQDAGTKQWIVDLMNDVQSGCVADACWTQENVRFTCDALSMRI